MGIDKFIHLQFADGSEFGILFLLGAFAEHVQLDYSGKFGTKRKLHGSIYCF